MSTWKGHIMEESQNLRRLEKAVRWHQRVSKPGRKVT